MALQNTSNQKQNSFGKELNKDINGSQLPNNSWTHARNAINNSKTGDLGKLGNEPANQLCVTIPNELHPLVAFTIIGVIHISGDKSLIFSTDGTHSEIGIFDESECSYTVLVNADCLNFSTSHLITGVCRPTGSCTYKVYWDDYRNNPSRVLEFTIDPITDNYNGNPNSTIPWIQECAPVNDPIHNPCPNCHNTPVLDCDAIRLAKLVTPPCINITNGTSSGTLLNGSYFIAIAYSVKGQKVTDWYVSNIQSIFSHGNASGSIDVTMQADSRFDEMQIAIVYTVNQQTQARLAGVYGTNQTRISYDSIDLTWENIPIADIVLMTPSIERSDVMCSVGNYLIRCGVSSREDFNYQPLANQIVAKWVSVEYPADYYHQGGNKTNYLRDEVYAFFIRWIFNTGDKSSSYHIPGRPNGQYILPNGQVLYDISLYGGTNALEGDTRLFETYNTASTTLIRNTTDPNNPTYKKLDDGGIVASEGYMGYWESSESYPSDSPEVWNGSGVCMYPTNDPSPLELCGKHIRHHRMPEQSTHPSLDYSNIDNSKIRILGVEFENIKRPVDIHGNPIEGIIGYEILRGSRKGNKTILAKGIINNMGSYSAEGDTYLYPNYPYNDLRPDPFLSTVITGHGVGANEKPNPYNNFQNDKFTFHSPETNFTNPFLANKELKVYNTIYGISEGKFEYPEKHPRHKLIGELAFYASVIAGIGAAILSMNGKQTKNIGLPSVDIDFPIDTLSTTTTIAVPPAVSGTVGVNGAISVPIATGAAISGFIANELYSVAGISGVDLLTNLASGTVDGKDSASFLAYETLVKGLNAVPYMRTNVSTSYEDSSNSVLPFPLRLLSVAFNFVNHFTNGADSFIRLIEAIIPHRQFALTYRSHCFYDGYDRQSIIARRTIGTQEYIGPQITQFGSYKINNLYRVRTVALATTSSIGNLSTVDDSSRVTVGQQYANTDFNDVVGKKIDRQSSVNYVALKQNIRNLYGQVNGVRQVPISYCPILLGKNLNPSSTGVLFGGDTYVGRYTEKNTFFYFYDWLYGQPDSTEFNYTKYKMLPNPTYWANFEKYDTNDFTSSIGNGINIIGNGFGQFTTPKDYHFLDGRNSGLSFHWQEKYAYFYLFNSGIRDFYVESEYNLANRDWGNDDTENFYNPYNGNTDVKDIFRTEIIKSGNYYKYDQSLSIGKLFINDASWAATQPISYNPQVAHTCFTYYPKRVIYSLPLQQELLKDNWEMFLTNNYIDFKSRPTTIKAINKSGAMIFFDDQSPIAFQGLDQLETTNSTKLTIGDGGLFSQAMQNIVNVDNGYEYGSCQDRLSVINCPSGLYWMSQNQGKIFSFAGQLKEITSQDLKWWFASYLPYKLTESFPNFELTNNPVIGIGCQAIYDNENALLYFCKKDYIVRQDLSEGITLQYDGGNRFTVLFEGKPINNSNILLGDPLYFEDASWTISYDPKIENWISFHDWHPNLTIPSKNTFLTIIQNTIWKHNDRCDLYCNYYGIDYPFELEFAVATGATVESLRSIEYIMEVYKYAENCYDRFHVLDFNFDEATVYNSEQTSGLLKLNMSPKNQPWQMLQYPRVNTTDIDIVYSKQEQKYRFNQFWDTTADRGEYNANAQRMIWNTAANGYVRILNDFNLNYAKSPLERKKFRHYLTYVLLRRLVCGDRKMLVVTTNSKQLISPR